MAKRPAFLCYASDFITGALWLSPEEKGVYYTLVMLMYDKRGPINDDLAELGRFCGCTWQKFRVIRNKLVEAGKIIDRGDGTLSNDRFERELSRQKLAPASDAETASPDSSPPHKPGDEPRDEPRHKQGDEPLDQNYVAAKINGLAGPPYARVARGSSTSTSISTRLDVRVVAEVIATIGAQIPTAIGNDLKEQWRQQLADFVVKDGIDPKRDFLHAAMTAFKAKQVPTALRSMGYFRAAAVRCRDQRIERGEIEPVDDVPALTDQQWTEHLRLYLDLGVWRAPGPEPIADGCLAPSDLYDKANRVWQANGNHPVRENDSLGNKIKWTGVGPFITEPTPFGKQQRQR